MSQEQLFYPQASCLAQGALVRTRLANAKVRLFKQGLTPAFATTLAELVAAECDFDGYTLGGITVATWSSPTFGPGQAAFINGGIVNWSYPTGGAGVMNLVGGFWVNTSDNVLWVIGQFADGYPMQVPGAGLPLALGLGFGSG